MCDIDIFLAFLLPRETCFGGLRQRGRSLYDTSLGVGCIAWCIGSFGGWRVWLGDSLFFIFPLERFWVVSL